MQNFIQKYKEAGYSFFNTQCSQKKLRTSWKQYQTRKPNDEEINNWLKYPIQNWAIVCGEISNLVVFDVDTKNGGDPTPFQNLGLYEVQTPSGGYHFYTPYDDAFKSTKHNIENGILKAVDIQTNGSIVFAPPSEFPQGKYTLLNDAEIKPLPDDLFARVVAELEPEKQAEDYVPYIQPKNPETGRPGDIFNALASWDEVLLPLGWTKVGNGHTGVQFWRRPGKKDGISASTNWNDYDLFFCYSSSIPELDIKKGYTKFRLFSQLVHDGDYRKAAKALVIDNYKRVRDII